MKSRKLAKPAKHVAPGEEVRDGIVIRHCHGIEEFEACVRVEREVWKSSDIDVVPIPLFVVASETGGQVLGAFHGADLIGFTMAIAGWRNRKPFLHSHMTAVLDAYRDRRRRPPAEALSTGRRPGPRNRPDRVDVRSSGNQERLLQFHAPRRDCAPLSAERLRNHHQSLARVAPHGSPRCGMASHVSARAATFWQASNPAAPPPRRPCGSRSPRIWKS